MENRNFETIAQRSTKGLKYQFWPKNGPIGPKITLNSPGRLVFVRGNSPVPIIWTNLLKQENCGWSPNFGGQKTGEKAKNRDPDSSFIKNARNFRKKRKIKVENTEKCKFFRRNREKHVLSIYSTKWISELTHLGKTGQRRQCVGGLSALFCINALTPKCQKKIFQFFWNQFCKTHSKKFLNLKKG